MKYQSVIEVVAGDLDLGAAKSAGAVTAAIAGFGAFLTGSYALIGVGAALWYFSKTSDAFNERLNDKHMLPVPIDTKSLPSSNTHEKIDVYEEIPEIDERKQTSLKTIGGEHARLLLEDAVQDYQSGYEDVLQEEIPKIAKKVTFTLPPTDYSKLTIENYKERVIPDVVSVSRVDQGSPLFDPTECHKLYGALKTAVNRLIGSDSLEKQSEKIVWYCFGLVKTEVNYGEARAIVVAYVSAYLESDGHPDVPEMPKVKSSIKPQAQTAQPISMVFSDTQTPDGFWEDAAEGVL